MLVRGARGLDAAPGRRAGGARRPRRPRPRAARGARGRRRPRPRAGRAVHAAGHRGAARRRGRAVARGLPRGRRRAARRRSAPGPRSASPSPIRRRWRGLLDQGFAGACVAADALGGPAGYDRLGPVLETLERRDAPLLVHPGPAAPPPPGRAAWWSALTDYVAAMQTAWYAFAVWGRPAHPRCASASRCSPASRRCTASGCSRAAATRPRPRCLPRRLVLRRARGRRGAARDRRRPARLRLRPPRRRAARPPARRRGARRAPRAQPLAPAAAPRPWRWPYEPRPRPPRAARPGRPDRRRPGEWRALVRHGTPERHFEQLWRDDHVDVWVITWTNGNDTGFHDHDLSSGAVAVVEGEVTEERLVVGGPPRRLHHAAGEHVRLRRLARASHVPRRRRPRGLDPRLLAAAVAHGDLHRRGPTGRCAASRSPTPRSSARSTPPRPSS